MHDEAGGGRREATEGAGASLLLQGHVRISSYDARTHDLVEVVEQHNVLCAVGITALLHLLASDGAASAGIQYLAVGTGAGTPAASDVALSTELARQATTQATVSGSTLTLQIFLTSSQANGTWTEIGAFGNGATSTPGSGALFGHAALSPSYVKSSSLETVVAYSISLDGGAAVMTNALIQPFRSGLYYCAGSSTGNSTATSLGNGNARVAPLYVPNAVTLSKIGLEVTSAGSAGCTYRLGIWNDSGSGYPGTLLLDAGTIAGDSATVQEITISQAIGPGLYWIGAALQGAPASEPTVRVLSSPNLFALGTTSNSSISSSSTLGYIQSSMTGALVAWTNGTASPAGSLPKVFCKVA